MYRPPSSCFRTFLDDVSKVSLIAAVHPTETIVCGDFNTRYKDSTCTNANNLADLLDTYGVVQHVSDATHERGNILDLIITAKTSGLLATPVSPTALLTDHYVLECALNVVKPERPKRRVCYRKFASINKRVFSADIINAFAVTFGTRIGPSTTTTALSRPSSTCRHRSSSLFVRGHRGIQNNCSVRNVTSVAQNVDGERHD